MIEAIQSASYTLSKNIDGYIGDPAIPNEYVLVLKQFKNSILGQTFFFSLLSLDETNSLEHLHFYCSFLFNLTYSVLQNLHDIVEDRVKRGNKITESEQSMFTEMTDQHMELKKIFVKVKSKGYISGDHTQLNFEKELSKRRTELMKEGSTSSFTENEKNVFSCMHFSRRNEKVLYSAKIELQSKNIPKSRFIILSNYQIYFAKGILLVKKEFELSDIKKGSSSFFLLPVNSLF